MCRGSMAKDTAIPLCVSSALYGLIAEPYVSVQYMDRELSPPGSPLMVLLQGLSELHFSACMLCVCSPMIPRLFAVMSMCLPKSRPGGEVEGNVGCQRGLTMENTRQELWRLLILKLSVIICYRT